METNINMTGERTTADIPVTKMTASSSASKLLTKYQDGHHCTTNYEKMCIEHNAIALDKSYLPIGACRRIVAKTVPILKVHHKDLMTRENSERTERQIVPFFDHTTGTTHDTTVRQGIPKIRNQMTDNGSRLTFKVPALPRPPEMQEPMASAVQDPIESTILLVPPPELHQAAVIVTHEGPSHIQMPPPTCNKAITAANKLPGHSASNHRAPQQ